MSLSCTAGMSAEEGAGETVAEDCAIVRGSVPAAGDVTLGVEESAFQAGAAESED